MKYLKNSSKSDLKQRISQVLLLMNKLDNKLTNVERSYIFNELKVLKEKYVRTRYRNIRAQVIERIVKISNDLYNKQKQDTRRLFHDQAYFGLRDLKYLFEEDNNDYEAIFVRSALDGRFEEYEISFSRQVLSLKEYLTMICLPLKKLIDEKQKSNKLEHNVQLRVLAVFTKVNNESERQVQYIDFDNLKLGNGDNTERFIKEIYDLLLQNFEQKENSLRGSKFVFSGIDLILIQFLELKLRRDGSYIPTPERINVKKAIINHKNTKDERCFAYSIIVSIHFEEIGKNSHRTSKLKPFIDNYDWTDIIFPSKQKDWDKFEINNKDVLLNILSAHETKNKINIIRVSKFNRKRKLQVILFMIPTKSNKSHYVSVKRLSRLCRGLFSHNYGDLCCLNGSGYDYHFIIKELAKKVDRLECTDENSEKYITFKAIFNGNKETYKLK